MTESVVEINGHQYRYVYNQDTKATEYLGPVGDAPPVGEAEFLSVILTMFGGLQLPTIDEEVTSDDLRGNWKSEAYVGAVTLASGLRQKQIAESFGFITEEEEEVIQNTWSKLRDELEDQLAKGHIPTTKGRYELRDVAVLMMTDRFQMDVLQSAYWANRKVYDEWGDEKSRRLIATMAEESVLAFLNDDVMQLATKTGP
jgi:hypothetical protein